MARGKFQGVIAPTTPTGFNKRYNDQIVWHTTEQHNLLKGE